MAMTEIEKKDAIRAYGNFFAGCIMVIAATFDTCFNIYAVDLKKTFGYSQTELEFVAAAGMVGLFFALPCPLLMKRFGFNKTMVITFFIAEIGMVGMGICASFPEVFSNQIILFSIFQFMASNGNVYLLLIAIDLSVASFPIRHAGKLIGVLNAFCSIGNIVYVGIYSAFFGSTGNVAGLFFAASGMVAFCLIGYTILQNVAPARKVIETEIEPPSTPEENHNQRYGYSEKDPLISKDFDESFEMIPKTSDTGFRANDVYEPPGSVLTLPILATTCLFHLIAWPSAISETVGYLYMNNISSMLESLGIEGSRDPFIIALTLASSIVRIGIGAVFDVVKGYNRRVALLISSSALYVLSIVVIFFDMNSYAAVMTGTIISGLGLGVIITISLAFLTSMFGKQNNILVQGCFLTLTCFVQLGMHLIVGHFYDVAGDHAAAMADSSIPECFNNFCFLWSLILMLIISSLSIGLYSVLYIIKDKMHLYR